MADAMKKSVKNKSDMEVAKKIKREFRHECVACKETFQYNCLLKYHIRSKHFNRVGTVPYAETQKVNQVWFEKVGQTDVLVKMEKVSETLLFIQKLKDGTTIQPTETKREVIDLRKQYPVCSQKLYSKGKKMNKCRICQKNFGARQLSNHFYECHPDLVKEKCETCGIKFKRLIFCARHICSKAGLK